MKFAVPLALLTVLVGGAGVVVQGPLPGDVAVTGALQSALGSAPAWAGWLTATAKAPLLWVTLVVAAGLAWQVDGWRAAAGAGLAWSFAFAADKTVRGVLFMPRPDPALVAVADPARSSGLPSTFGLVYGALFGAVLLAQGKGKRARFARLMAGTLLIAGTSARIVLGGHWLSQMLASTAFGLLLAAAALAVTRRMPVPGRN